MDSNFFADVHHNGESYSLAHLNPFEMSFYGQKVKKELKLRVIFSDHCFTERADKLQRSSERVFSLKRFNLSLMLPDILKGMCNEKVKVYQTSARRNFAYVVKIENNGQEYNVFFEVRKNNKSKQTDLVLRVESAYTFDDGNELQYSGNIRFLILCQKIYLGEKIKCRKD